MPTPEESSGQPDRPPKSHAHHGPGFWARRLTDVYTVGARGVARAGAWWGKKSNRWSDDGIAERWAENLPPAPATRPIWIHAASMGEVQVGAYFAEEVVSRGYTILASAMTETGFELAQDVYPTGTVCFRVPFDLPGPMRKAFAHFNPEALLLVETEWWPNFLVEASRREVPVFVVNGRLTERAFNRYKMGAAYWRSLLRAVRFFFMRTEEEAERVRQLGVEAWRVRAAGSLKVPAIGREQTRWDALLSTFDPTADPVWLAGCVRPGEEKPILNAYQQLKSEFPRLQLWMAPRHPKRVERADREIRRAGFKVSRWTNREPFDAGPKNGEVVLIDRMGILSELYARAAVSFIGGSLRPFGGHNLLEPALLGCPVVFGPHVENHRDAAEILIGTDRGIGVQSDGGLETAVAHLLREQQTPVERRRRATALRDQLLSIRSEVAEDLFTFLAVVRQRRLSEADVGGAED